MADIDPESLAETILRKLRARKPADEDDEDIDTGSRGRGNAESRIRRLVEERNAARKELQEMGAEVEALRAAGKQAALDLKAAHDKALADLREQASKEVQSLAARSQEDLAMVDAGLRDPVGREALRLAWNAAPKAERGDSPMQWWQTVVAQRDAHLADTTKPAPALPKALQGYLPDPPKVDPPKPAPAPRSGAKPPPVDRKVTVDANGATALDRVLTGKHESAADFLRDLAAARDA